jgi:platelet-activating factor acetylhydrolase
MRGKGYKGGSSRGLEGVDWSQWKHRFHVDKMTIAGHSFGAATVVEVLRHPERFTNVQAGIIYDIWGAPIKPPAEDPRHRIHLPLLGISSEAFMYWEKNWDSTMSLMKETSEHGAPAYLLTVRGSVHISQSDFSILYKHVVSFFLKATVHPQRAIDLNVSTSLEFLRLVTPAKGGGKSIIDRCMTDEHLLETPTMEDMPTEHRPNDEWIAARLHVDHEFRKRTAAGLQRKFKRNFQGGMGTGYTTSDEMWCFHKPSEAELQKWIEEEERGEKRIDEDRAMGEDANNNEGGEEEQPLRKERTWKAQDDLQEALFAQNEREAAAGPVRNVYHEEERDRVANKASANANKEGASANKWVGILPAT